MNIELRKSVPAEWSVQATIEEIMPLAMASFVPILAGLSVFISTFSILQALMVMGALIGIEVALTWGVNALEEFTPAEDVKPKVIPKDDVYLSIAEYAPDLHDDARYACLQSFLFLDVSKDTTNPSVVDLRTMVERRLPELYAIYGHASEAATSDEIGDLTADLARTIIRIGAQADEGRKLVLADRLTGIDTIKRYLDDRTPTLQLSPV
jgi:hypothetical protein